MESINHSVVPGAGKSEGGGGGGQEGEDGTVEATTRVGINTPSFLPISHFLSLPPHRFFFSSSSVCFF